MSNENKKNSDRTEKNEIKKKSDSKKLSKTQNSDPKNSEINEKIIADLKVKLQETEDKLLRELAENDNLRKRHEKEITENHKYAIKNFAYDLLNITDNFDRALASISQDQIESHQNLKSLVVGLKAVEKEIYDIFEKNGIKKFESLNKKFDPDYHQAVSKKESKFEEGQIIEELQKGFVIGDRLLRPSMVVVSSGKIKENS